MSETETAAEMSKRLWKWQKLPQNEFIEDIIKGEGALRVEFYLNYMYKVTVAYFSDDTARITIESPMPGTAVKESWRMFQRIKDEILPNGENWEGVQVFPARERLADEANQYHLWCCQHRLEVGWYNRRTYSVDGNKFDKEHEEGCKELLLKYRPEPKPIWT